MDELTESLDLGEHTSACVGVGDGQDLVVLLLESLGNLVHVLRLGDSLEVVLENFCEVVCKFLSACPSLVSIS